MLTVWYACLYFSFEFVPHDLPLLHSLIDAVRSISIQLIHLGLYLLPFTHHFLWFRLCSLTPSLHFLSDTILLVSQYSVKIIGGHLEVLPSHKHVCRVEGGTGQRSDVCVFLLDFFDFFLHFLLHLLNFFVFFQHISHLLHIFRLFANLFQSINNKCLDFLWLLLNLSLNNLN